MRLLNLFYVCLIISTILFSINSPHSSDASLNADELVFYTNKTKVFPNESISFFVGLRSGGNWQSGSITLKDLLTNAEKTYNINAEFTLISDFLLDLPTSGFDNETHIIEAIDGVLVKSLEIWVYNHVEQCPSMSLSNTLIKKF